MSQMSPHVPHIRRLAVFLLDRGDYVAKLPNSMRSMKRADNVKTQARVIKAMAHPARLAMLHALADGERCVCDLRALVGSDMSTVSKHLSVMKKAGLVEARRDGLWMHYRLRVPCIMDFLDCVQAVLNGRSAPTRSGRACCVPA